MDRCDQAITFPESDRSAQCVLVAGHDGPHQAIVEAFAAEGGAAFMAVILWPLPDPSDTGAE